MAQSLLAASGGDTVKLFDVSVEKGDPCTFQHAPSPSLQVNCVRWNHTNLVVASAGDDRKISLWMKNGQVVGVLPERNADSAETVDECILAICFSSKGSRYMCSGGSGKVIRVWDLQRRRCIKWLKGHTETITGVGYNCRDEHLASVSLSGDLNLHNLASGNRAAELKDPNNQVLRVLEYSKISRHLLVTAGDDGSVHLWDTTGRTPKMSWNNQHLAPTTGVCFSPCNDKLFVSVGLDKKLYAYDPGMKKPVHCVPCEAPFSSLAFRDDGGVLAAGTNSGRVVFYDIRGKLQPFTILRAYGPSEAVSSLSWQRSDPVIVNEANCSMEAALLGPVTSEDSVLMPDPLPAPASLVKGRNLSASVALRAAGMSADGPAGSMSNSALGRSVADGPKLSQQWTNGAASRLQTPRSVFGGDDDMEVFSPLVDVQPIMPSMLNSWDQNFDLKKDAGDAAKKTGWGLNSPNRRLSSLEEIKDESRQQVSSPREGMQSPSSPSPGATRLLGLLSRSPSATPPEAWGGDAPTDRGAVLRPAATQGHLISRFASPTVLATQGVGSAAEADPFTTPGLFATSSRTMLPSLQAVDADLPTSRPALSMSFLPVGNSGSLTTEVVGTMDSGGSLARKLAASGEKKLQANSSQTVLLAAGDGQTFGSTASAQMLGFKDDRGKSKSNVNSPKRSESSHEIKLDAAATTGNSLLLLSGQVSSNGSHPQSPSQHEPPPFALQLVQRALEESLGSVQQAIHEDVQNLHLELLRQFHIQQVEMRAAMGTLQELQANLLEEVRHLRRENQRLADL